MNSTDPLHPTNARHETTSSLSPVLRGEGRGEGPDVEHLSTAQPEATHATARTRRDATPTAQPDATHTTVLTRRAALATAALAGAAMLRPSLAQEPPAPPPTRPSTAPTTHPPGEPGRDYTPVVVPDGVTLPYRLIDGVKVFHLVANTFKREFTKGLVVDCWGWNGHSPGPVIEAVEGDRVRIYVTNNLPAPTTIHWHGMLLPCGMDGVGGLTQAPIPPGQTFKYEFTLRQSGTLMYHPHFDEMTQIAMGMTGMFVIHPREPREGVARRPRPDRDFALMLAEWLIRPGTSRPDTLAMSDFNVLTLNSKAFPGTAPLVVRQGQRVRIRLGNLGPMDHHPIHLHGYHLQVTGTDAGPIPQSAWQPATTVLVPVGATRDIEFVADAPGDWALHCHMTHHMMNQMGHGTPNMVGIDPRGLDQKVRKVLPAYMTMGETGMGGHAEHMAHMPQPPNSIAMKGGDGPFSYIDMGGMFTILKVREGITSYDDPGWFQHPPGTVSAQATPEELRRDGVERPTSP